MPSQELSLGSRSVSKFNENDFQLIKHFTHDNVYPYSKLRDISCVTLYEMTVLYEFLLIHVAE